MQKCLKNCFSEMFFSEKEICFLPRLSVLAASFCVTKLFRLPLNFSRFPFWRSKIVIREVKQPDVSVDLLFLFARLTSQILWVVVVLKSFTVINVLSSHLKIFPVIYAACWFKIRLKKRKKIDYPGRGVREMEKPRKTDRGD